LGNETGGKVDERKLSLAKAVASIVRTKAEAGLDRGRVAKAIP